MNIRVIATIWPNTNMKRIFCTSLLVKKCYCSIFMFVLSSDVMSDEQIGATFENDGLPVIKRAYSLKAAKQPKEASKVTTGIIYLANTPVAFCPSVLC